MLKLKKLISLACAVCVVGTGTIVTGLMGTTASAAASDMANCLNTKKSYAPTSMGVATTQMRETDKSFGDAIQNGTGVKPDNCLGSDGSVKEYYKWKGTTGASGTKTNRHVSRIALRGLGCKSSYNATDAKILHIGYTMENNSNAVIDLMYTYNYNNGSAENGAVFTTWDANDTDSNGNMLLKSGDNEKYTAYVNPKSYHADWFVDCENATYRLYIDNIFFAEGSLSNASGNYYLKNFYFAVRTYNTAYDYKISDQVYMTYIPKTVNGETITPTMDDVVAYTLTKDTSRSYWWPTSCRNDDYYWRTTGIGAIGYTGSAANNRRVGGTSGIKDGAGTVSGDNYIVQPSTKGRDYGGVGYRLRNVAGNDASDPKKFNILNDAENNNVIVQTLTIVPNLTEGKHGAIGFRGNNTPQSDRYKFSAEDGFVNGQAYKFDIVAACGNYNDTYYYDAYIFVDDSLKWHGVTATGEYLSEIVYALEDATSDDTLTLSNITTTCYDSKSSVYDIVKSRITDKLSTAVRTGSLSGTTLTCRAEAAGAESIIGDGKTAKVLFAAYTYDDSRFLSSDVSDISNNNGVNSKEGVTGTLDISGAESGSKVKIYAFIWDGLEKVKPLSSAAWSTYTYTAPTE